MSPRDLAALRPLLVAWNHRQQRAREEYAAVPIASDLPGVGRDRCEWGECTRPERDGRFCTRHQTARNDQGAA